MDLIASCLTRRLKISTYIISPDKEKKQASRKAKGLLDGLRTRPSTSDLHFGLPTSVWPMVETDSELVAVHTFLYLILPVMNQGSGADN